MFGYSRTGWLFYLLPRAGEKPGPEEGSRLWVVAEEEPIGCCRAAAGSGDAGQQPEVLRGRGAEHAHRRADMGEGREEDQLFVHRTGEGGVLGSPRAQHVSAERSALPRQEEHHGMLGVLALARAERAQQLLL